MPIAKCVLDIMYKRDRGLFSVIHLLLSRLDGALLCMAQSTVKLCPC